MFQYVKEPGRLLTLLASIQPLATSILAQSCAFPIPTVAVKRTFFENSFKPALICVHLRLKSPKLNLER
jgi:hypothetical protein